MKKRIFSVIALALAIVFALSPLAPAATASAATYKKGSSGSAVAAIHEKLITLGYMKSHTKNTFDAATVTAVKKFQQSAGIGQTGTVNDATSSALTSAYNAKIKCSGAKKTVTVKNSVANLRKGPGTRYLKLSTAKKGTKFTVTGIAKATNGKTWYRITKSSKSMWICSAQVSVTTAATTSSTTSSAAPTSGTSTSSKTTAATTAADPNKINTSVSYATATAQVNLRKGAGTEYSKVSSAAKGKKFPVISSKKGSNGKTWYQILSGDTALWMCGSYASISKVTATVDKSKGYVSSRPNYLVRQLTVKVDAAVLYADANPSSKALAIVKKGQVYSAYTSKGYDGTSWYKLTVNGVDGYISRKKFTVVNKYTPIADRDFDNIIPKIYLSPSKQNGNPYKVGSTNEKAQMEATAKILYEKLQAYECDVHLEASNMSLDDRAVDAYNFGADIYVAIHSNATGNSKVGRGANAYYYPGCAQSKEYAKSVIASLNKVTAFGHGSPQIHDGMAFTDNFGYAEVRGPGRLGMISILVETEYHDNADSARWIIDNKEKLADALLESLVNTLKLKLKDTDTTEETTEGTEATEATEATESTAATSAADASDTDATSATETEPTAAPTAATNPTEVPANTSDSDN